MSVYRHVWGHMSKRKPKGITARLRAAKRRRIIKEGRSVYEQVWERDKGRSRISGEGGYLHRHHIIYRSRGGKTTLENVCLVTDDEHRRIHAGEIELVGNANVENGLRYSVRVNEWMWAFQKTC